MRLQKTIRLARQVEDLVRQLQRHVHQVGGLAWSAVHLWSGGELLQDARWETLKHCRSPFLEQVSGLAADLRAVARQAHEDDREKRMMSWKDWLHTEYKVACNWSKGVDNEKNVMVQREGGTHAANAKQLHTLVEQAWIPIFKMHELGTRPTWSQFEAEFAPANAVSLNSLVKS